MQQKVVSITPKQFLFQSSVVTRTFAILFILFTVACIVLTTSFMTIHTTSKDVLGKTHWTGENPYLAYSGIATGILTLVCGIVLLVRTVKIFGWSWNTPLGVVVILSSISLGLMVVDVVFLFKRECVDPDKYLNQLGVCVCKGSLVEKNGTCVCPPATLRDGTLCLAGCSQDSDCPSGQCGENKFCCPPNTVSCGDVCCDKQYCQTVDGKKICCADTNRVCKDKCCPVGSTCIDKVNGICAFKCGPFNTLSDERCHIQEGDANTLKSMMDSLIQQDIPEKDTDGKYKIKIDGEKLYFVTKVDPNACTWNSDIQYTPLEIISPDKQVDFKPCIPTGQLGRQPTDTTKDDFSLCVPKEMNPQKDNQWQTCRTDKKCEGDCQEVNYATYNYVDDPDKKAGIIRKGLLQSIQPDAPGVNYVGNYCGAYGDKPKEGAIKIISRKVDTCKDPKAQSLFCQLSGGFTNSVATFGEGTTCNAIIDCDQEITGLKSQTIQTMGSDKVETKEIPYTEYKDSPPKDVNKSYLYQPTCPGDVKDLSPDFWPNNLDQFRECPDSLAELQSKSTSSEDTGQTDYNTYLCSKNTGQMFQGNTKSFRLYKLNFDFSKYDPRNPPNMDSLFKEIQVPQCDTQVWSGDLDKFENGMCITPSGRNTIMEQFTRYSQKPFITSNSTTTLRFNVKDGNNSLEILNYGGVLTTYARTQQQGDGCKICIFTNDYDRCERISNGGFLRVIVDCCNWLGDDRIIEASDRVAYFNDDASGHPFSALIIAEAPRDMSGQVLQFNSDAGACDITNNYCDVNKPFAIAQCERDYNDRNNESQIAWNWIPQDIDIDDNAKFIEKLTGRQFLWQGRLFKFRKSNCTYAGRFIGFTNGDDPGTGCPGLNISPDENSAAIMSFKPDQTPSVFAPKPSPLTTSKPEWWVWLILTIVILLLSASSYGAYVLSKTPQKRRQKK